MLPDALGESGDIQETLPALPCDGKAVQNPVSRKRKRNDATYLAWHL